MAECKNIIKSIVTPALLAVKSDDNFAFSDDHAKSNSSSDIGSGDSSSYDAEAPKSPTGAGVRATGVRFERKVLVCGFSAGHWANARAETWDVLLRERWVHGNYPPLV